MRRVDGGTARALIGALAVAITGGLAACSTVQGGADASKPGTEQPSLATKLIMGNANPASLTPPVDNSIKQQCPPVEILQGAASYPVYEKAGDTDPYSLRYQATLADTARECSNLGVEAGIRVGVVGRVIVGPKGAPGVFRVPLRIAVVDENDKPVYSQSHLVDVTVPAGQSNADFSHIEDNIVVPIPSNRFAGWRILVGYDPKGAAAEARPGKRHG